MSGINPQGMGWETYEISIEPGLACQLTLDAGIIDFRMLL